MSTIESPSVRQILNKITMTGKHWCDFYKIAQRTVHHRYCQHLFFSFNVQHISIIHTVYHGTDGVSAFKKSPGMAMLNIVCSACYVLVCILICLLTLNISLLLLLLCCVINSLEVFNHNQRQNKRGTAE